MNFLFASKPEAIGPVLGIVHRVIAGWQADDVIAIRIERPAGQSTDPGTAAAEKGRVTAKS